MEIQEITKNMGSRIVGEMVAKDYRTAEVFKKFGIDFCCGGKKNLQTACQEKSLSLDKLNEALFNIAIDKKDLSIDYNEIDLDTLADHIVHTHHNYVSEALPILDEYAVKVASVHGDVNPELNEIAKLYQAVSNELRMHMHKEEVILFPYIRQMAVAKRYKAVLNAPPFGTIKNPIHMMESEHEFAGDALASIKELSSNYSPPEHACNTYLVFYAKLKEFEADLHQHIHLENNILFPKAIKLEEEMLA